MIRFNSEIYNDILKSCEAKNDVEFLIDKESTPFRNTNILTSDWTEYPIPLLPKEDYARIFVGTGANDTGRLMRLQIAVYLDGGKVLYKDVGQDVGVRVSW